MVRRSKIACIFRKELRDAFRDRKSMINVLIYALLGPIIMIPMLVFLAKPLSGGSREEALHVPGIGVERAPALMEALLERNILVDKAELDPVDAVRSGRADVVVVVADDYATNVLAGRPGGVRVVSDGSRTTSLTGAHRVTVAIESYGRRVGVQRLLARGVSPSIVSSVDVMTEDVSTPQQQAALLLGSVPMFVLMAMIMGSCFAAVDVTAGERERGSLEPLLANPVTTAEVVLGKLLCVAALGAGATIASVSAFGLVLELSARFALADMSFALSLRGALLIILGLMPLSLMVAALEMLLAASAKTVREANTVVMMLTILPVVPGMAMLFGKLPSAVTHIPVVAEEHLIVETLRGETITVARVLIGDGIALAAAALLVLVAIRLSRPPRSSH
jgi:sodium transport system permease protein